MDLSKIFPPSDLLDRVRGVEAGLRQRRRIGGVAWFGVLLTSTIEILLELKAKGVFTALGKVFESIRTNGIGSAAILLSSQFPGWPYVIPFFLVIFFLLLATWSRFWLKASRHPFRQIELPVLISRRGHHL